MSATVAVVEATAAPLPVPRVTVSANDNASPACRAAGALKCSTAWCRSPTDSGTAGPLLCVQRYASACPPKLPFVTVAVSASALPAAGGVAGTATETPSGGASGPTTAVWVTASGLPNASTWPLLTTSCSVICVTFAGHTNPLVPNEFGAVNATCTSAGAASDQRNCRPAPPKRVTVVATMWSPTAGTGSVGPRHGGLFADQAVPERVSSTTHKAGGCGGVAPDGVTETVVSAVWVTVPSVTVTRKLSSVGEVMAPGLAMLNAGRTPNSWAAVVEAGHTVPAGNAGFDPSPGSDPLADASHDTAGPIVCVHP